MFNIKLNVNLFLIADMFHCAYDTHGIILHFAGDAYQ